MLTMYLYSCGAHSLELPYTWKTIGEEKESGINGQGFVRKCRVVPMSAHHESTSRLWSNLFYVITGLYPEPDEDKYHSVDKQVLLSVPLDGKE